MWPGPSRTGNRYTVLLYEALEEAGIRYVEIPMSLRYVLSHGPSAPFHYVHFHWPEVFFFLRRRAPQRLFGFKGYLHLHALWFALKLRGYRLVWTVHEVDVHDAQDFLWAHHASRRLLWRLADVVFTHAASVREKAVRRWGERQNLHTLPHGNYSGAYPDTISRAQARLRLGIPDAAQVFVSLGNLRPYKGIEGLLQAFQALQPQHPEAHLVIAGQPHSAAYGDSLATLARDIPNLHLLPHFVPDPDVQVYMRAADCFVAPYVHLETCGAIHLALTFDLPVVVTKAGNTVDLAALDVGIFMHDPGETEKALRCMLALSAAEREALRERVRRAARLHSWAALTPRYREAFEGFEAQHSGDVVARSSKDNPMSQTLRAP